MEVFKVCLMHSLIERFSIEFDCRAAMIMGM